MTRLKVVRALEGELSVPLLIFIFLVDTYKSMNHGHISSLENEIGASLVTADRLYHYVCRSFILVLSFFPSLHKYMVV